MSISPEFVLESFGIVVPSSIKPPTIHTNIDHLSDSEKMLAIHNNPENIRYITDPTDAMCVRAVAYAPNTIRYIKHPSPRVSGWVCEYRINQVLLPER